MPPQPRRYPPAPQSDTVDTYHGTPVPDPYRPLEELEAEATRAWIEAQNALTDAYLASLPVRERIRARLTAIWDFRKTYPPLRKGEAYFYRMNDGLQNQPVLYRAGSLDDDPVLLLDPNTLSADGTVAVGDLAFSPDGRTLAYSLSESGSDWQEIHFLDTRTGEKLPDLIREVKFSGPEWSPDGGGLYYTSPPRPGGVPDPETQEFNRVMFHRMGSDQSEDHLIFDGSVFGPSARAYGFVAEKTGCLLIWVVESWSYSRTLCRPLEGEGPFTTLIDEGDGSAEYVGEAKGRLLFRTDIRSPRGRLIAVDPAHPDPGEWRDLIPEGEDILPPSARDDSVKIVDGKIVALFMHNAHHLVRLYDLEGKLLKTLDLPTLGTVHELTGGKDDGECFFLFESFVYPPTVMRYDFNDGSLRPFNLPALDLNPADYEVKQVFFASKDGTQVPMFITHKQGIALDGNNPTLLWGYGGFNLSKTPEFYRRRDPVALWLEAGGVYVLVNLRGGAEFGEEWHRAGMRERKQNTFDDFIAAGEALIELGYTRSEKLAAIGASNGGLLVAACLLQRPDLFGAVVSEVPVTDMLRYPLFTAGRYWVGEWGDAEADPEAFRYLHAYSPYHNVVQGESYPPTLIHTATSDDRVVPLHAYKFAAMLQEKDSGLNPIYLSVETKAGHGEGKPTGKLIAYFADIYAFLFDRLGMEIAE